MQYAFIINEKKVEHDIFKYSESREAYLPVTKVKASLVKF